MRLRQRSGRPRWSQESDRSIRPACGDAAPYAPYPVRTPDLLEAVRSSIAASPKDDFRVVHFSIQSNHLHLIVEATDERALSRGMQGLSIRMARAVHRALGHGGTVFSDRYHAHQLETPRQTRAALLYVLQNWAKHGPGGDYDPRSSASWFDGWTRSPRQQPGPSPSRSREPGWSGSAGDATASFGPESDLGAAPNRQSLPNPYGRLSARALYCDRSFGSDCSARKLVTAFGTKAPNESSML